MPLCSTSRDNRRGFTLLEVILALAILAGAVAVLGEVMSIAGRNAADAQAEAEAQSLAASIIDEMLAGYAPMTQQTRQPLESAAAVPWVYSVTLADTSILGLSSIEVLVEQDVEQQFRPVKFKLVRWFATDQSAEDTNETPEDSESSGAEDDSNA
ncbi:MAG: prepilin-type N-terminal cleavage/methylation domain-containing protein [Planctomycetota bacterium]